MPHGDPKIPKQEVPELSALPFAGLGLDQAKIRRNTAGLRLRPFAKQETLRLPQCPDVPPVLSGYGLLIRLCRETLGS